MLIANRVLGLGRNSKSEVTCMPAGQGSDRMSTAGSEAADQSMVLHGHEQVRVGCKAPHPIVIEWRDERTRPKRHTNR
jgi:hypothetical protein